MKISIPLVCVFGLAAVFSAAAAEDGPRGYSCEFKSGNAWSYGHGAFKNGAPSPLSFEIKEIDLDGQAAKLVTGTNGSPGTLRIVRAVNANHFLEIVNEGFLNLTTIYDKDAATGAHPAAHSRHLGLLGEPIFAQYAGSCTEK